MAILKQAAALTMLAATACVHEPTPIIVGEHVLVYGVLLAGVDTTSVLVARNKPGLGDNFPVETLDPVTNASVRIVHPGGVIALTRGRPCTGPGLVGSTPVLDQGCYSAVLPGGAQPGVTYSLEIDVPGEPPIRGSTRVPRSITLHEPAPDIEMHYDSLPAPPRFPATNPRVRVRWSGVEPGALIEIRLRPVAAECTATLDSSIGFGVSDVRRMEVDTALVSAYGVSCIGSEPHQRRPAHLMVTAFDSAYTRYRLIPDPKGQWFRNASVGITGGIGVFGAAANAAVPVTLVPK